MALIASADTTALTLTPQMQPAANRHHEIREFVLPEDGKAHVVETTEAMGAHDSNNRRAYASSDKTKYREEYEKYAKDYYVAPSMEKLDVGDPHDLTKPFRVAASVVKSHSGVMSASAGEVVIPLSGIAQSVPDQLRDYQEQTADAEKAKPAKKRVHDFLFPTPSVVEWTYRITLPTGYAPRTLPQNEKTPLGTAMLTADYATEADGTITANVRFDTGKRRLTAAEFEETRMAISKLARRDLIHIGFEAIGQTKLNAGDVRGALAEFRKLSELHPKEAQHHIEMARALLAGGLGEAARDEAKRAVTVEPSNANAHAMLAEVLEHDLLGRKRHDGCDIPGAIAALRQAKKLEPTNATFRGELAQLLTFGDGDVAYGRNAHLKEAADEYASLLKDLGKDGKGYEPPLMLVYAHAGRWTDVKAMLDKTEDQQQRDLFRLISTTAVEGSEAGVRELKAFDAQKRRSFGMGVGQTLVNLRMYAQAADFFEAATQGAENASKVLPFVQILRKCKAIDSFNDDAPRGLVMKLMAAVVTDDIIAMKKLFVPEVANWKWQEDDDKHLGINLRNAIGDLPPTTLLDMMAAMLDVQQDGNDDIGYRLRPRMAGTSAGDGQTFYVQKRDGKYFLAGVSDPSDTIAISVLKLANDGKVDAARIWLNWVRESVTAGGGDDPLSGPAFARIWQKEKQTATLDEVRAGAAALMYSKDSAAEAAVVLAALRAKADRDETKTALDLALSRDYMVAKDWANLLPVAERLSKAHPDSGTAFGRWSIALARLGRVADAEALANERLARLPKDRDALSALSNDSAQKGDYDTALSLARKLVDDLTPTNGDYNHAAWLALFRGKDFDQAIEDARRASSNNSWGALHTLAALYAETGKSTEARQALLKSIERRTSDQPMSVDWFVLGRIAENYGVSDAAAVAYKKVKKEEEPDGTTTWELTQKRIAQLGK
jgi:tetratricopeptide (TPR) repeat protein